MDFSVIYSIEKYADIVEELKNIYVPFFKEVDIYPEAPTPNVDHDQFIQMGDALQVVTARENRLVGFHIAFVINDIFYKHIKTAMVSHYYLLPESRGNGNGTNMFAFADDEFKRKGVERVFMSRKIYMNNEKLFNKLGYRQIECNYTKAIL